MRWSCGRRGPPRRANSGPHRPPRSHLRTTDGGSATSRRCRLARRKQSGPVHEVPNACVTGAGARLEEADRQSTTLPRRSGRARRFPSPHHHRAWLRGEVFFGASDVGRNAGTKLTTARAGVASSRMTSSLDICEGIGIDASAIANRCATSTASCSQGGHDSRSIRASQPPRIPTSTPSSGRSAECQARRRFAIPGQRHGPRPIHSARRGRDRHRWRHYPYDIILIDGRMTDTQPIGGIPDDANSAFGARVSHVLDYTPFPNLGKACACGGFLPRDPRLGEIPKARRPPPSRSGAWPGEPGVRTDSVCLSPARPTRS
jgi:hypothetical protein